MENMRRIAYEIVLRACGFGSLAIFCVMIGMSFEPTLAFKAGGFLTTLMSAILILKAYEARTKNYRKTELWLYLPKEQRPAEEHAQWASATVLQRNLSHLCKVDRRDCDCDVGAGTGLFYSGQIAGKL